MFGGNKFEILGVEEYITEKFDSFGWLEPTDIQKKVIPLMLKGNDVIALAETGSGKTGAFAIPILQKLFENPKQNFALILTPTHELAVQIKNEFVKIYGDTDLKVVTLLGGDFIDDQVKMLKQEKFHIVIGTPGRIVLHIQKTKALKLKDTKFLILDEADRMLSDDFVAEIETIVAAIPKGHQTCLFSATMTNKLEKLETACLKNPARVEVSRKHQTVEKLKQEFVFLREDEERLIFLVWKLQAILGDNETEELYSTIVFTPTKKDTKMLYKILKRFDISVVMLQSDMSRKDRQESVDRFTNGKVSVLVATDVASRGLDIPSVSLVINYNVPKSPTDYQHRVGRTARAGRSGLAISLVTPDMVSYLLCIEKEIGVKMTKVAMSRDQTTELKTELAAMMKELKMEIKEEQDYEKEKKMKSEKKNKMKNRKRKHSD